MNPPVVESREGRRIVCRLAEGDELIASIRAVCTAQQVRAATLFVTGVLDSVALAHYAKRQRGMGDPRWFRTPVQLLAAQGYYAEREGQPEVRVQAVVSRLGDNGIEVLGGELTAGPVLSCALVIDAMDDLLLRCRVDPRTGLVAWTELLGQTPTEATAAGAAAAATAASAPAAPAEERWAAAAAASSPPADPAPAEEGPEEEEEYRPMRAGDLIEHTTFGRCQVERVDGDGEFAIVRLRNNRLVRLNLDVLDLRFIGEEDEHQVFGPRDR